MIKTTEYRPACPWEDRLSDPELGVRRLEFAAGSVVYESRTPARELYFLHEGQVHIRQDDSDQSGRLIQILGPGDWFGDEALASPPQHPSRAMAMSKTALSAVRAERLMALAAREPHIAAELLTQLATRLQSARDDGSRFVFDDCGARLINTLLHFSTTSAATLQDANTVMLRITHRQLADAIGAARETVSLALSDLRHRGMVVTGRNRLTFQPDALRKFAGAQAMPANVAPIARHTHNAAIAAVLDTPEIKQTKIHADLPSASVSGRSF